jgi:hypothetical protein
MIGVNIHVGERADHAGERYYQYQAYVGSDKNVHSP